MVGKFSTQSQFLLIFISTLLLFGCDDLFKPTIPTICETNPDICAGLNEDGWCRAEKAEIIRHRYDHLNVTTDSHIYTLLKHYEAYEACIEKAAGIRHIKYREKEANRMQGLLTAIDAQKKLIRQTKDTNDPYLLYYHWSRNNDDSARKRFLAQARQGNFDSADLWIKAASIHLKRDNEAARKSLYKALSYYDDVDDVDPMLFESLVTVNLDDERYASAYVWANVYAEVNEMGQQALARTRPLLLAPVNYERLEGIAWDVEAAINDGAFNADRLGLWRLK
ncbi:DUF2989 domain-containing protein [Alteromonas sediminis]|nr:DUF2989 domain-containing protein [Alteromonas sediminis]